MIEILKGFPDNVIGFVGKGHVTREDYEQVLIPKVDAALKQHDKIRLYYELGSQFSEIDAGAMWEDFKAGVEHLTRWDHVAIVTDVDWIKKMLNAFRFIMPGRLKVFPTSATAAARSWIVNAA